MRGALRRAKRFAQRAERGGVGIVAVDVAQQFRQLVEGRSVDAAVLFNAVACARDQLIPVPRGLGNPDHRHIEMPALHHRLQRREDLLVREIACGAEKHQRVGMSFAHRTLALAAATRRPVFRDGRRIRSASPTAFGFETQPARAS